MFKARFRHRSVENVRRHVRTLRENRKRYVRFVTPTSLSYGSDDIHPNLDAVEAMLAAVREEIGAEGKIYPRCVWRLASSRDLGARTGSGRRSSCRPIASRAAVTLFQIEKCDRARAVDCNRTALFAGFSVRVREQKGMFSVSSLRH